MPSRPCLTRRQGFHRYPVCSTAQEINKRRKSAARMFLFANFRVFSLYFRANSVEKKYRKAIINYLREKYANLKKDLTVRLPLALFRSFGLKSQQGQDKDVRAHVLDTGYFSHLFDNLGV